MRWRPLGGRTPEGRNALVNELYWRFALIAQAQVDPSFEKTGSLEVRPIIESAFPKIYQAYENGGAEALFNKPVLGP